MIQNIFYAKFDREFKVISIFKYLVIQNGDSINLFIKKLNKLSLREASLLLTFKIQRRNINS